MIARTRPVDSPLHRLPAHAKFVSVALFVIAVVVTPPGQFWAFGGYALLIAAAGVLGRVRRVWIRRVIPVELALLAPVLVLWQFASAMTAWHVLAKASLALAALTVLLGTTDTRNLIVGLQRLRLPTRVLNILTFMISYADVTAAEMRRMRIARQSRRVSRRDLRQLRVFLHASGALLERSYERGRRVYRAMLSRGYDGTMRTTLDYADTTQARHWVTALALPTAAGLLAAIATVYA